ncbi:MAG: acyl carrier protein [Flavobacteriales bacterium]
MTKEEILKSVTEIFIDVLDDEDIVLSENTTADDVEDWDSLTHIQLIVATEKKFNIKFTAQEIRNLANVGEYCDLVHSKL